MTDALRLEIARARASAARARLIAEGEAAYAAELERELTRGTDTPPAPPAEPEPKPRRARRPVQPLQPTAEWPVSDIRRADVQEWIDGLTRRYSAGSTKVAVAVLRGVLKHAVRLGFLEASPALDIDLPADDAIDAPTYLDLDAQTKLLTCDGIPEWARITMRFAMASGLRGGELVNMHLDELRQGVRTGVLPVRWGSPTEGPKNGPRDVRLLPAAVDAGCEWLSLRGNFAPGAVLAFPSRTGERRRYNAPLGTSQLDGKACGAHHAYLVRAGLPPLHWHAIARHTCAVSLVSGLWGRRWTSREAAEYIGDSVGVFDAYYGALAESAAQAAADSTPGGPGSVVPNGARTEHGRGLRRGVSAGETSQITTGARQNRTIHRFSRDDARLQASAPGDALQGWLRSIRERLAAGVVVSAAELTAFAGAVQAADPVAAACAAALVEGPFQAQRVLELGRLVDDDDAADAARGAK